MNRWGGSKSRAPTAFSRRDARDASQSHAISPTPGANWTFTCQRWMAFLLYCDCYLLISQDRYGHHKILLALADTADEGASILMILGAEHGYIAYRAHRQTLDAHHVTGLQLHVQLCDMIDSTCKYDPKQYSNSIAMPYMIAVQNRPLLHVVRSHCQHQ